MPRRGWNTIPPAAGGRARPPRPRRPTDQSRGRAVQCHRSPRRTGGPPRPHWPTRPVRRRLHRQPQRAGTGSRPVPSLDRLERVPRTARTLPGIVVALTGRQLREAEPVQMCHDIRHLDGNTTLRRHGGPPQPRRVRQQLPVEDLSRVTGLPVPLDTSSQHRQPRIWLHV